MFVIFIFKTVTIIDVPITEVVEFEFRTTIILPIYFFKLHIFPFV